MMGVMIKGAGMPSAPLIMPERLSAAIFRSAALEMAGGTW